MPRLTIAELSILVNTHPQDLLVQKVAQEILRFRMALWPDRLEALKDLQVAAPNLLGGDRYDLATQKMNARLSRGIEALTNLLKTVEELDATSQK